MLPVQSMPTLLALLSPPYTAYSNQMLGAASTPTDPFRTLQDEDLKLSTLQKIEDRSCWCRPHAHIRFVHKSSCPWEQHGAEESTQTTIALADEPQASEPQLSCSGRP
eukprot:2241088-Amphidinium_carterae.1